MLFPFISFVPHHPPKHGRQRCKGENKKQPKIIEEHRHWQLQPRAQPGRVHRDGDGGRGPQPPSVQHQRHHTRGL